MRSYRNPLNVNLLKNIREWGGRPIEVRIGGSSQAQLWWVPDQVEGLIGYYESGADKTYNVTIGPGYVDLFDAWPSDTKFIQGLPATYEQPGLRNSTIEIVSRPSEKLGSRLIGLELGNERQDSGLTPPEFANKFLVEAYAISEAVFKEKYKKIWTVGTLQAPTLINCDDPSNATTCWSTTSLLENGINDHGIAVRSDTHQYNLDRSVISPDRQYLLNHTVLAGFIDSNKDLADYSVARGLPYVFGESNNLFGHGRVGVSDTFAAALWNIDFTLYAAQTNISRIGYHQSFGWRYSAWRPIPAFGYPSGVLPAYYGFWIVQKAFGTNNSSTKQVEALFTREDLVVYGIYQAGTQELDSVIAINLKPWNSVDGDEVRPEVVVDFSNIKTACGKARVFGLTSAGADVTDPSDVVFAGQYINGTSGLVVGESIAEELGPGETVSLKASEAVLISLC
ncbi:hypothetical protein G7054_g12964 [Neopestalotiopsis clavispora]|nr:hypothetical protein G7054_g12964 [Neopestalotiopsis clavispora]